MGTTTGLTRRGFLTGATAGGDAAPLTDGTAVARIGEACLAPAGIHCRSCGDACPETAIRFRPRLGGPPLPAIAADRCTGCGACLRVCPTEAVALVGREAGDA